MKPLLTVLTGLALAGAVWADGIPPVKPGPGRDKYETEYYVLSKWRPGFPKLTRAEVLAPKTAGPKVPAGKAKGYNCIAHTLRIYDKWVWPGERIIDFDRLYGSHGYKRTRGMDFGYNPRVEKIVLYAKITPAGRVVCTHGCKQLADGTWTSKLGAGPLIRHATPGSVNGPSYGKPIAVYTRSRKVPVYNPAAPKRNRVAKAN